MRKRFLIFFVLGTWSLCTLPVFGQSIDDIILDIYRAATEFTELDYEQLQADLYALHDTPIDLNHTSDEELSQLRFLSPRQIDDILLYADKHPFVSLYELRLIPSLEDYEIRDLLPFVRISNQQSETLHQQPSVKEVFAHAHHELLTRVDARSVESFEGSDPVYVQARYRFDYRRRVTFGVRLQRPPGGKAQDLQYGAYIRLSDLTPHLHTLVAGNFQAGFGQGLVLAPAFHAGKSMYVTSAGQSREGLRHYSSVDGEGLHGAGATFRFQWGKQTRLDASALYSMRRANDSVRHHLLGANITFRHRKMELQLTAIENLWSDSVRPYRNANYNRHYFRGRNQAVFGASARYNHGWFDAFAELATAQNNAPSLEWRGGERLPRWGVGLIAGSRFYPASGVSLIALYRYYSPYFDNALGYAFSETSRINDENGGYLGFDITRLRRWRFTGYADLFYFSGYKYGLGSDTATLGYDVLAEARYHSQVSNAQWWLSLRARAKQKGSLATYSLRAQWDYTSGPLSLRTTAEANLTRSKNSPLSYGYTVYQDVSLDCSRLSPLNTKVPLTLQFRAQWFDAREWTNRLYAYEHDVLYAFSVPAVYGLGGRAYLCLRWQIIPRLALYFKLSETIYVRSWYIQKHPDSPFSSRPSALPTKTDLHLLLRATL